MYSYNAISLRAEIDEFEKRSTYVARIQILTRRPKNLLLLSEKFIDAIIVIKIDDVFYFFPKNFPTFSHFGVSNSRVKPESAEN